MGYLDSAGLAHFTAWVKARLSGKQDALTPDGSISLQGGDIAVSLPTKAVSKAEYDALTEEQKQADALYLVEEPAWEAVPLSIQEYDTEDGWHVRKWSNGYVEMILNKTYRVAASRWTWASSNTPAISTVSRLFEASAYPVKLTEIFSETPTCFANDWTIWVTMETNTKRLEQTQTARPAAIGKPSIELEIVYTTTVKGRWK